MMKAIVLFGILSVVGAQTNLTLAAAGAVPSGNQAAAGGTGTGADVVGEAVIAVTDTQSISGVTIAAAGPVVSDPEAPKEPAKPKEPAASPSTATATAAAAASATASGSGSASASADASATVTVYNGVDKPKGNDKDQKEESYVYYKKLVEKKEKPTCKDIKDDMCPAMGEFDNCGYCILQKYPLKGYGCPMEKYYVKKEGKKGEYEMVVKPACDCPEGALVIEKVDYCPSCELALMELLVCSGYDKMPKNMDAVEIKQECLKIVGVTVEYLEECGYMKPKPSPVVVTMKKDKEPKDDDKKKEYVVVVEEPKNYVAEEPKKYVAEEPKVVTPGSTASATATSTATVSGSGTASAIASAAATNKD